MKYNYEITIKSDGYHYKVYLEGAKTEKHSPMIGFTTRPLKDLEAELKHIIKRRNLDSAITYSTIKPERIEDMVTKKALRGHKFKIEQDKKRAKYA